MVFRVHLRSVFAYSKIKYVCQMLALTASQHLFDMVIQQHPGSAGHQTGPTCIPKEASNIQQQQATFNNPSNNCSSKNSSCSSGIQHPFNGRTGDGSFPRIQDFPPLEK